MDDRPERNSQTQLKVKVLHYPFMGTGIDIERLTLLGRLCYSPMGTDELESILTGQALERRSGRFIRGLIKSGHLGVLEHWYTTFAVEGYSRISSQQNDRHRLMKVVKEPGCCTSTSRFRHLPMYLNSSNLRGTKEDNFKYVTPSSPETP